MRAAIAVVTTAVVLVPSAIAFRRADPVFAPATLPKATVGQPYKTVTFSGGQYT